jgi:hypothetical protein
MINRRPKSYVQLYAALHSGGLAEILGSFFKSAFLDKNPGKMPKCKILAGNTNS